MHGTIVATPTHRGFPHSSTKEAIRKLCKEGAELRIASKISDIAGGRSWLLSECLRAAEASGRDVILCVDDDMSFTTEQAQQLVEHARATKIPSSAVYCTEDGDLAGCRWRPFRHLVGLGFAAIPVQALRALADTLTPVAFGDHTTKVWPFAECKAHPEHGVWMAEDYDLSAKLGGFQLLPIAVGHIKLVPLVPRPEDVKKVTDWENYSASSVYPDVYKKG